MITTNKIYGTSIQHKIFVSIRRILVITLLLIGIFSALVIRNHAQKTAVNHSNELLQMISQSMNQVIDSIDNSSKQVALNEQVINYCKNAESLTEYERIMIDMQLKNSLVNNIIYSNTLISNVIVYPIKGNSLNWGGEVQGISNTGFMKETPDYIQTMEIKAPYWLSTHQIEGAYKLKDVISYIRPIFTLDNDQIGVLELQIPTEEFSKNLKGVNTNSNSGILTLDTDGKSALLSTKKSKETEAFFLAARDQMEQKKDAAYLKTDGIRYLLNSTDLINNWILVYYQPVRNLTQAADIVILIILFAGIIMLTVMIYVSKNISQQLVQPIKNVIEKTRDMENIIPSTDNENEIAALFQNYNIMMKRIHESELDTLRAQISPHFLYNTLNSIKCRALIEGNESIGKMTQWLINLLELSINNRNEYVSITEEFQMLESYVGLQKMRSDREFTFYTSLRPDSLGECLIPKMILQTLVENALLHGLNSKCENAEISVVGVKEMDHLVIEVTDNGVGMSEEKIQEIMSVRKADDEHQLNRVGLFNVNQRIQLYFGKSYGLAIESAVGKGTKVIVKLPCVEDWKTVKGD